MQQRNMRTNNNAPKAKGDHNMEPFEKENVDYILPPAAIPKQKH